MIHFVVPSGEEWTIRDYLENRGRSLAGRFRIVHAESLPSQKVFEPGAYVLVKFEDMSGVQRRRIEELHEELSPESGFRFLNHPTRTRGRLALLEELRRTGRNEFRAARAGADLRELRFPVFLRSERSHEGALSSLLRRAGEVEAAIGRALLAGRPLEDLLVVEFCDTADADGLYRKYSAFRVGDRILPRNLEVSRHWVVKDSRREFSRQAVVEEREFLFGNPHEAEIARVFEVAGIEYGRIDYGLKNGRLQTVGDQYPSDDRPRSAPFEEPGSGRASPDLRGVPGALLRGVRGGVEGARRVLRPGALRRAGGSAGSFEPGLRFRRLPPAARLPRDPRRAPPVQAARPAAAGAGVRVDRPAREAAKNAPRVTAGTAGAVPARVPLCRAEAQPRKGDPVLLVSALREKP